MNPIFVIHQQFTPSRSGSLSLSRTKRRGRAHPALRRGVILFLAGLAIVLFLVYLFLTNSVVGNVFKASEYQRQFEGLEEQNRLLKIDLARLNSYSNILEESRKLNMVEAKDIYHLEISEDILARSGL